jgi:hypothetical protein
MPKTPTREPNRRSDGQLACAYLEVWLGAHWICQAAVAATCGVPVSDVRLADYSHLMPQLLTDGRSAADPALVAGQSDGESEPPQEGWLF